MPSYSLSEKPGLTSEVIATGKTLYLHDIQDPEIQKSHRWIVRWAWQHFKARLAYTLAAFNILVQWHGLKPDNNGFIHLSIAEFSL